MPTSSIQIHDRAAASSIVTATGLFGYRLRPPTHYEPAQVFVFRAWDRPSSGFARFDLRSASPPPIVARLRRASGGWGGAPRCGSRRTLDELAATLGLEWHFGDVARKDGQPTFFTERTLADYLAVSDRTIRNWIRRRELPSYKLGASRRIDPADVEDFLARHRDEAS